MATRNYFHNRLDKLGARKKQIDAPVDIIYSRASLSYPINDITIGKTDLEEIYPGVDILIREIRDFIMDGVEFPEDLELPMNGDVVEIVESDVITVGTQFKVISIGENACYKWTSATRKRIRIHSQIMKQVT